MVPSRVPPETPANKTHVATAEAPLPAPANALPGAPTAHSGSASANRDHETAGLHGNSHSCRAKRHPRCLSMPGGGAGNTLEAIPRVRYPASAITPPLPYLLDLERYSTSAQSVPVHVTRGGAALTSASSRPVPHPVPSDAVVGGDSSAFLEAQPNNSATWYPNSCPSHMQHTKISNRSFSSPSSDSQPGELGSDSAVVRRQTQQRDRKTLHSSFRPEEELHPLLYSVPPSFNFPLGSQRVASLESLASQLPHATMRPSHVFWQLQKLSSQGALDAPVNAHKQPPEQRKQQEGLETNSFASFTVPPPHGLQNDPLLWSLFMSQQTAAAAAAALGGGGAARHAASSSRVSSTTPLTSHLRSIGPPASAESPFPTHAKSKEGFIDGGELLKGSEFSTRVISDDPVTTLDMKLLTESRGLQAPQPASPSCLLIVVRRLPDKIVPLLQRRHLVSMNVDYTPTAAVSSNSSMMDSGATPSGDDASSTKLATSTVRLEGAIAGNLSKQHFDLTMRQAEAVEWCIERNEFGLDFALAFPDDMHRVIVADPAITFSHLSKDADVQRSLRRSLRDFLLERNIIPVFVDVYESARSERYSEEVLAPLFHYRPPPVSTGYHNLDWSGYRELNIAFLNALVESYRPGDWILVFNYQLMLLPKMLRERPITRDANIGFYLGTVFPSSEMYRILPQREELLRGVLAASFIGFHGFQYKRHFLTACTRVLGVECSGDRIEPDAAVGGGAGARVVTVPRGINPGPWLTELQKTSTRSKIAELRERLKGRKILLGIDTLDYTKGIPNKIMAFNKFLTDHPEWASKVVFYQICVPKGQGGWCQECMGFEQVGHSSRTHRREILATLYQLVGAINANFGSILHQPVHFLLSPLSVENLVCLYGLADIVVITPLRESLSWTAYEFVLCQSYTNKGVLILSEFSGSAQSLGAAAICVNPWDSDALAVAIHDALVMKDEEKLERHEYAVDYVLNYDTRSWGQNLLMEFRDAVAEIDAERRTIPPPFPLLELAPKVFTNAACRIVILGLRGTLFSSTYRGVDPQIAGRVRLSRTVDAALHVLSQDPRTHIVVVSSSPAAVLAQALGHFPNITLLAENGHLQRLSSRLLAWRKLHREATATAESPNISDQNPPPAPLTSRPASISSVSSLEDTELGQTQSGAHKQQTTTLIESCEFEQTTADIDLSWMDPVEESCRYFEQRTPGSFLYRTKTSISWNYRGAQREHGTRQARDLLIHLWARPATVAARTSIVLGPHSVEVRSAATSKAAAVERWLHDVLAACDIPDVSQCMVLCVANFIPCDEDVFTAVTRVFENYSCRDVETTAHKTGGAATEPQLLEAAQNTANPTPLPADAEPFSVNSLKPSCFKKEKSSTEAISNAKTNWNTPPRHDLAERVWMCTVGLKPSRADYWICNERDVEHMLTLLAILTIIQPGGIAAKLLERPASTPDTTDDAPNHDATTTVEKPSNGLHIVSAKGNRSSPSEYNQTHKLISVKAAACEQQQPCFVAPSPRREIEPPESSMGDSKGKQNSSETAAGNAKLPWSQNPLHCQPTSAVQRQHQHYHHGRHYHYHNTLAFPIPYNTENGVASLKQKRRVLPCSLDIPTLCASPDIQRALLFAAHHYYLPNAAGAAAAAPAITPPSAAASTSSNTLLEPSSLAHYPHQHAQQLTQSDAAALRSTKPMTTTETHALRDVGCRYPQHSAKQRNGWGPEIPVHSSSISRIPPLLRHNTAPAVVDSVCAEPLDLTLSAGPVKERDDQLDSSLDDELHNDLDNESDDDLDDDGEDSEDEDSDDDAGYLESVNSSSSSCFRDAALCLLEQNDTAIPVDATAFGDTAPGASCNADGVGANALLEA